MSISEVLTQEKFKELLQLAYIKGQKTENIVVRDLIDDFIQQVNKIIDHE